MKIAARLVGHQSPVAVPPGLADRQPEPDRLQRRYVVLCTSGSATVRSMSMTGLAASPGTEVEPTCSSCSTRQPRACRIRPARWSYCRGQAGSGLVTSMPTAGAAPGTHGSAPQGGAESTNDTISARLGINAVYGRSLDVVRVAVARMPSVSASWCRRRVAGALPPRVRGGRRAVSAATRGHRDIHVGRLARCQLRYGHRAVL